VLFTLKGILAFFLLCTQDKYTEPVSLVSDGKSGYSMIHIIDMDKAENNLWIFTMQAPYSKPCLKAYSYIFFSALLFPDPG